MNIRDIDGLWCDDITFCPERCGWMNCPRNKENIRDKTVPHSFSVEIPQDCPKKQEGRRSVMPDREKFNGFELCANGKPCIGEKFTSCPFSPRNNAEPNCGVTMARFALSLLKEQEAVVRCKDCKHYKPYTGRVSGNQYFQCEELFTDTEPEWYCADGERK